MQFPRIRQPFVEITKIHCDREKGIVQLTDGIEKITFMMPHMKEELKGIKNLQVDEIRPMRLRKMELLMTPIIRGGEHTIRVA